MKLNPATLIDAYKSGHIRQYPEGSNSVYSNFTPRSGKHFPIPNVERVLFFGLQGIIKWLLIDFWNTNFFSKPLEEVLSKYSYRMDNALGKGAVSTDHIKALHDLGFLPLRIKALPEGELVPFRVPVLTIRETLPEFFWLTNYFEDMLSCELWPVTTTATSAFYFRHLFHHFALMTGVPAEFCSWQGHDFSFRGMRGIHDAAQSGSGHLVSFLGTDTFPALDYIEEYYGGKNTFLGGSVPATEHSVMSMGSKDSEIDTFRRLITQVYPSGVVSIVSDTWDFWRVITEYALELKDVILARQVNEMGMAKVVFRPDSGNPVDIICGETIRESISIEWAKDMLVDDVINSTPHGVGGEPRIEGIFEVDGKITKVVVDIFWNRHDKQFYYVDGSELVSAEEVVLTPAQKGAVQCLWDIFGGTVNEAGFKVLNERVGLIYGDSITYEIAEQILEKLMRAGFASNNIVFGLGSYQAVYKTRDSLGFAMKATYGEVNGEARELFKDPKTGDGVKRSAKGLLRVERENDTFVLYDQQTWEQEASGALETVFLDGKLIRDEDFATIRRRVGFVV